MAVPPLNTQEEPRSKRSDTYAVHTRPSALHPAELERARRRLRTPRRAALRWYELPCTIPPT